MRFVSQNWDDNSLLYVCVCVCHSGHPPQIIHKYDNNCISLQSHCLSGIHTLVPGEYKALNTADQTWKSPAIA